MTKNIEAIFLDTGNTLRVVEKDATFQNRARQKLVKCLGVEEAPDAFCDRLTGRYQAYKQWLKENLLQPPETELWTRWLVPDLPAEKVAPLADQLTRLWLDQGGRRVPRPDAAQTIRLLADRGYALGIIANSVSATEIPEWLEKDDLAQHFKVVLLSARFGRRKPDPAVFLEAARLAGAEPARCAYVGDNPSRDIEGARRAGFGMTVILLENATLTKEPPHGKERPEAIVRACKDLLTLFPPR